jgi:glycosyltransferase involved in cell wall biosynthesis
MPNSLLEAMACGRLCIAGDVGGISEIIDHGRNVFSCRAASTIILV